MIPIAGLSPDVEPSPQHMSQISDLIESDGITTVFSETLGSKEYAETLANDLGVEAAVLDPIEGLPDDELRRGLPFPHAGEPRGAPEGERLHMSPSTPVIEVTGGNLALGGRPILRTIDLSVRKGEVVAVLGANGSGKSTLVRALMGLSTWTSGEMRLFGKPLNKFREWHRVGYVPQRVTAASGVPATVAEVVASGRLSRRRLLLPHARRRPGRGPRRHRRASS